jgi:hypothetical protein
MRAARLAVGASLLLAPAAHAALQIGAGRQAWPTLTGLVLGLAAGRLAGERTVVIASLAVAPIWPVIGWGLWPSPAPFDPVWPWLAFVAGGLAWPAGASWRSDGWWRVAMAAWALVLAATWPVVAARELDFTTLAIDALTVNGASGGSPVNTASFVMLTAAAQLAALLLFDWCAGQSEDHRGRVWRWLVPGLVAAAAAALWQQLVDPAFLSVPPWTALRRSAGTFFDANATAAWLALAGPAVAAQLTRPIAGRRPGSWLLTGVLLGVCLAGILATGSRTALAGFLASALLFFLAVTPPRVWLVTAGLLLASAAVLLFARPAALAGPPGHASGNAARRLLTTVREAAAGGPGGIVALLRDRDGYGVAARAMIADHPWFGVGTGAFAGIVGDYGRTSGGAPLPPDNAQNWWRQQAAELGRFGSLPAVLASVLTIVAAMRALAHRARLAAAAPLAGLGVMALVSPPTAHPILQVVLGLVVAAAVAHRRMATRQPARGAIAVWIVAVACAAGTAAAGWRELRPPFRAARFHFTYNYGTTDIVPTPFGEGRWMKPRAVAVIPPTGARTLVARIVAPHDDLAQRPVRIVVSSRQGPVCAHVVVDHTPFECRVPVPHDAWPMIRVDVDRVWRHEGGVPRAAVVSARFE